jgi:hypothetical protein
VASGVRSSAKAWVPAMEVPRELIIEDTGYGPEVAGGHRVESSAFGRPGSFRAVDNVLLFDLR